MKANNKILSRTLTFMLVLIMLLGCMSGIALAAPADEVAAHKTLVESLPISDSIKDSVLFYLPLNGDFSYDGKSTNTVAVENSETNPITFVDSSDRGAVAKFTGNHQYDNSSINLGLIDYGKGDTTMDVSFACWIKNDATSQPDPAIVSNKNWWSGANAGFYFGCYQNHSLLRLNLKAEGQNRVDMFGTPVNDNNWHYVVMTMDRHTGVYTLFVDGVKVETATYSNTALLDINTGFPTRIGSDGIGQTGFVGLMSDFMMFDTALSAAEVTELMEYFSSNSVTPAYPEATYDGNLVNNLPASVKDDILFYFPLKNGFNYGGKSTNTVTVENDLTGYAAPISFVRDANRGIVADFKGVGDGSDTRLNNNINLGMIDYGKGDNTMDFSFGFWYKAAVNRPGPTFVSNKNWYSGANPGYVVGQETAAGVLRLNLKAEGQIRIDSINNTSVADGKWHYMVLTLDRQTGTYTLYKDGIQTEVANNPNTALLDINTIYPTRIGSDGLGQYGADGQLSEFMMFDKALSAEEVEELAMHYGIIEEPPIIPDYPEATYDGNLVNNLPASVKDDILFYFPLGNGFNYGGKSTNAVTVENDLTDYTKPISFVKDDARGIVAEFKGVGNGSDTRLNNNINLGMIDYGSGDNTMDFSFGFWYKAVVNRPGPTFVSNKNWYSGANPGYVVGQETSAGVLRLNLKAEGQIRIDSINNTSVADGKWHYMVLTLDRQAGTYTLYKDGVQAEVANNSNTALLDINTIYPTRIGSDGLGQFGLDGQLSEFVMFDKALSAVEVMELAKSYGLEPPKSPLTYTLSNEKTDAQVGDMFTTTLKIENKTADIYDNVSATLVTSGHNSKTAQVTLSTQDVLLPGESTTLTWTTKVTSGGLISTIVYINADDSDTAKIQGQPVNIPTNSAGWYNVDGHSHTVYSDGSGTVAQNLEQARQNAVNALVQTDHHNSNGWNDAKTYVANNPENGMLPIRGNEYTTSTGHAIVLDIPESFVSTSYSGLSWKAMLAQAKTMGSLLFIAHPFEPGGTFWNHGYDDEGYVGLEVWSNYWGPRFAYNQQAFDKWDALNREGRKLYGITVTDAHSARMIGQNWMSVYLPNGLNTKNLMEGMSVGSMYGSNGPHLELTAVANGKTGMMGDSLEVVAAGQDITFNVKGNYADGLNRLIVIKNGVKEQTITIGDISFDKNITLNVKPGDFVRVELEGYEAYGKTFVTNNTHATDGKCAPFAFSNPIFFDEGEEVVDKTALDAVIAEAELLDENKYTADSWNVLAAALENAKAVNASETCTQAQVDAAAEELKAAIEALVAKTFTVKFVDFDGTVLKEDTVKYGKAAAAPADPAREGYTFDGWDEDFSNITADMTVTAQYTINAVSPTLKNAATSANEFISIEETKKNSGVWILSFTVMETYSNGEIKVVSYAVEINANNANVDGSYDLGSYALIYDIKGNGSNIKEFRIILN